MNVTSIADKAMKIAEELQNLYIPVADVAQNTSNIVMSSSSGAGDNFVFLFTIFVLAVFIGYYVVWSVTPALHSPLMAITNAISSVIIVGALIAAGPEGWNLANIFVFIAVILASVNIFGGFIVTQRMLQMFRQKR